MCFCLLLQIISIVHLYLKQRAQHFSCVSEKAIYMLHDKYSFDTNECKDILKSKISHHDIKTSCFYGILQNNY